MPTNSLGPEYIRLSPRGKWIIKNLRQGKILHIGFAGSENDSALLFRETKKSYPQSQVYGIDINKIKVERLAFKNTQVADGRKLPFKKSFFDCAVLAEVIEHQVDFYSFLTEAFRVLKKDGALIVTTPNPYGLFRWLKCFVFARSVSAKDNLASYLGSHEHVAFPDPLSLINLLYKAGFRSVTFKTTNPSYPYLPKALKEISIPLPIFDKFGTYSCLKAIK